MKDLIGRQVEVGHYIAYALIARRSANLAIYQVTEVFEDKIKALKINASYGMNDYFWPLDDGRRLPRKYVKWSDKDGTFIEKTDDEKAKVDNKLSTLTMSERIFILNDFSPDLIEPSP